MNNGYLKISSRNRSLVVTLAFNILNYHIQPREFNNIFYIEIFSLSKELNIPRHLVKDDINIIYIKDLSLYFKAANYIYSDGFLNITYTKYSDSPIIDRSYLTKREVALKRLEERYNYEAYKELLRIKDSKLYYSILERVDKVLEARPRSGRNDARDVFSKKFQELSKYFEVGKSLNFPTFVNLFE